MCVIQYKFNVLVNSPQACINTNYTLLGSSTSRSMTSTHSTSDTNVKDVMEADAISGNNNLCKNFIYNELPLTDAPAYIGKNAKKCQRIYFSHTQIYEYI